MLPPNDPVQEWLLARGCRPDVVDGGLDGLLDSWERVVVQVEGEYPFTLDDYLNDLDARDLLDRAMALATDQQRQQLMPRLHLIDQRFHAVTVPSGCVWGDELASDESWSPEREWWYYAKPKHPGPDLASNLRRAGL